MKKIKEEIKECYKREEELYKNNYDEILKVNKNTFNSVMNVAFPVLFILVTIISLIPSYSSIRIIYILLFTMTALLFIMGKLKIKDKFYILGLYAYLVFFLAFAICLSCFVFPKYLGASIIGVVCLGPILILDKTKRISTLLIIAYLIHTVLAFCQKDFILALNDSITVGAFLVASLYLSFTFRDAKFFNMEFKRLSYEREHTDFLTNLGNRRKLFETLKKHENEDAKSITGIIMIDIDWFKKYNDYYGHQAGDICLQKVGACLTSLGKKYNLEFFRYGGEEFIAINSEYELEKLKGICQEIINSIYNLNIKNIESTYGTVTCSAGLSYYNSNKKYKYEHLIGKADEALYIAKENGRNKYSIYNK